MAHIDKSRKIEFILDDQQISVEKASYELLKPIASVIGQYAKQNHVGAVSWFEEAFGQIIKVAREILAEQKGGKK